MLVHELIEYLKSLPKETLNYKVWSNDGWGLSDPLEEREVYVDDEDKRVWI